MHLPLKKTLSIIAVFAFFAGSNTAMAFYYSGSPSQKLERLLQTHFFRGGVITPDIKAATGDPNIPVIDRRKYGDFASCSFRYEGGRYRGRVLYCE